MLRNMGRLILKILVFFSGWFLFHYLIDLTGFAQVNILTSMISILLVIICSIALTVIVFHNR